MQEQQSAAVKGLSASDYFVDRSGLLLGNDVGFSVGMMLRSFAGVGLQVPFLPVLDLAAAMINVPGTDDAGYFWAAGGGFSLSSVTWYDTALAPHTLSGDDSVGNLSTPPGAMGTTVLGVFVVDQSAPLASLYINGCRVASVAADYAVPALPQETRITSLPLFQDEFNEGPAQVDQELLGLCYSSRAHTPTEIAEHYNACQLGRFLADGAWQHVWDARRGIPNIDDSTTEWIDEVGGVALERVVIGEATAAPISARARFR